MPVSLQQNTNSDNTHTCTRLSPVHLQNLRFIETINFKFLPQEITELVTWKPTQFLRPGTRLRINFLSVCWPPRGVPVNVKYRGYTHDTKRSFYSAHFLLTFFFIIIYLADVLHRYCLGGALHVGMYRPRKALLDCPLLQHSSPGPKWTICMLHHSAQGIQINWCTWQFHLYRPTTTERKYITHTFQRLNEYIN